MCKRSSSARSSAATARADPRRAVWALWLLGAACGPEAPADEEGGCSAPGGARPASIEAVVDLVDALPSPVTLPCLLSALDRPLSIEATSDVFSAQPAPSERSPRMFLLTPGLTMTVVPEGPGAPLLELGEASIDGLTVKAEILFPVEAPLAPEAPYERVRYQDQDATPCGMCHGGEVEVETGVFASLPLRPAADRLVPLAEVAAEAEACGSDEGDRCALLRALFGHGEVVHGTFPESWATIYDPR